MTLVFISHSNTDDLFVSKLTSSLRSHGIETWVDHENLRPLAKWTLEIGNALDGCDVLLFVASASSLLSTECSREWNYALGVKKPVVPILIEKGIKLPFRLYEQQWLDFTDDFAKPLEGLVNAIHPTPVKVEEKGEFNSERKLISLTLDLEKSDLNTENLISFIADLTHIGIHEIKLINIRLGSAIVELELPEAAVYQLVELVRDQPELFSEFRLIHIEYEDSSERLIDTSHDVISVKMVEEVLIAIRERKLNELAQSPLIKLPIFDHRLRRLNVKNKLPRQIGKVVSEVIEGIIGKDLYPGTDWNPHDPEWRTYHILLDYYVGGASVEDMASNPSDKQAVGIDVKRAQFHTLRKNAIATLSEELVRANQEVLEQLRVCSLNQRGIWDKYANPYIPNDERDITETLLKELSGGEKWIFALTGVPGVGKTKIAYEVGKRCYDTGRFMAVVAIQIKDTNNTLDAIADAICIELNQRNLQGKTLSEKLGLIHDEMKYRDTLLILDNMNTFTGSWQQFSEFLVNVPRTARIILTTQWRNLEDDGIPLSESDSKSTSLLIAGLKEFPVKPMSQSAALKYMRQQATTREIFPEPSDDQLQILLDLWGDYFIPAMMRFVLGLLKRSHLTPERFDESVKNFRSYNQPSPEFEQLLDRYLGQTLDHINSAARLILHMFRIFETPAEDKAIYRMAEEINVTPSQVASSLDTLYRIFLVEQDGNRFDLLPYTRDFIIKAQREIEEQARIDLLNGMTLKQFQHNTHIGLAAYYIEKLQSYTIGERVKFLGAERENIIALLEWCNKNEYWDSLISLIHLIGRPLGILGRLKERIKWGTYAVYACKIRKLEKEAEWFSVHDIAWTKARLGQHDEALRIWRASLKNAREQKFKNVEALALYNLSQMSLLHDSNLSDNLDQAIADIETSVNLWKEIDEPEWMGHSQRVLGLILQKRGKYDEAMEALQEAHENLRAQSHMDGIISTLADMSVLAHYLDNDGEAIRLSDLAIERAKRDIKPPAPVLAYALWLRAKLAAELGEHPPVVIEMGNKAVEIYEQSFASYWADEAKKWLDDYKKNNDIESET